MGINESKSEKNKGFSANRLLIPFLIIIILLHVVVIFLFFSISKESQELTAIMQKTGVYSSDASSLLGGSSILSETASNFILMPLAENGEINYSPLAAYAEELKNDRRGQHVEERFNHYEVSDEDRAYIAEAANAANNMMEAQLHALALMNSMYEFADVPGLSKIPLPELSAKEKAYSKDRKERIAHQLILGTEYALNKQTVSKDVNLCVENLQRESSAKTAVAHGTITRYRNTLWVLTVTLIIVLALTFILLYRQILIPLRQITQQIRNDQPLTQVRGLREVREVAVAYNNLLRRRDTLDNILRSAAVTDALTNLPNRYAFQQYLVESNDEGYSLAVLLFDVNYLKKTNDTKGHAAGDELLRQSADCISTCFGSEDENNCFRLGGDEFAVVIKNPAMDIIDKDIQMFIIEQQRRHISISWGCALASELKNASIDDLVDAADKRMYEQKKEMHKNENS